MTFFDWLIILVLLAILQVAALYTKKFTRNVADFLAANRCAGRYLLAISSGIASVGAISYIAFFENVYTAGLTNTWWAMLDGTVVAIMMLSGWIIYRFRQTRALTLAQFLEMRYSRNFRIFAGILCWLSGIINFGIFPAVGAKFFMAVLRLPENASFLGIPVYALILIALIGISYVFAVIGGQISVIVTDFIQGLFVNILMLIIVVIVVLNIGLPRISETIMNGINQKDRLLIVRLIQDQSGESDNEKILQAIKDSGSQKEKILFEAIIFGLKNGKTKDQAIQLALDYYRSNDSLINPMKIKDKKDFNFWYYIFGAALTFYAGRIWQGSQAYNSSALTPHEARMANVLSIFRFLPITLFTVVLPLCAFTFLNSPFFADKAEYTHNYLDAISNSNIARQMATCLAVMDILPIGLKGAFVALMLAAFISTHDTYMHSWGSIFIQDVIMPFRKSHLNKETHLKLLRISILGVCFFIFLFSLFFRQTEHIVMFWNITGAIFTGGAGTVVIGGLYWKRGTTTAAWSAMIIGSFLSVGSILLQQYHAVKNFDNPILLFIATKNGMTLAFWSSLIAVAVYVVVSLLQRSDFNMDKLLHRGAYEISSEKVDNEDAKKEPIRGWRVFFGFTPEFSRKDKWVYSLAMIWMLSQAFIFVLGTILGFLFDISDLNWMTYWKIHLGLILLLSIITTVWFIIGGIRDLLNMFQRLESIFLDDTDDGVVNHVPQSHVG